MRLLRRRSTHTLGLGRDAMRRAIVGGVFLLLACAGAGQGLAQSDGWRGGSRTESLRGIKSIVQVQPGTTEASKSPDVTTPLRREPETTLDAATTAAAEDLEPEAPQPITARLTIRSNVSDDEVYLDGAPLGPTPRDVEVLPGSHVVEIRKEGCVPASQSLDLGAGDEQTLRLELNCPQGAPSWAEDERLNRRVLIDGGEFLMGSTKFSGSDNEYPQHRVRLSPFYLQEHEVTNEEYRRFKSDHEFPRGQERHPAVRVSWKEASDYAEWLGGRLPTEAEWEYAARAGTTTKWSFGNEESEIERYAWVDSNSGSRIQSVGELEPNAWGLYDMHGNVCEWVADWYRKYPEGPQVDPLNTDSSSGWRVVRGGSFYDSAVFVRSAARDGGVPGSLLVSLGFRVVLPAPCRDSAVDPGS